MALSNASYLNIQANKIKTFSITDIEEKTPKNINGFVIILMDLVGR